jgi:hypothetical protein
MIKKLTVIFFLIFLLNGLESKAQCDIGLDFHPSIDFINFDDLAFNYSIGIKNNIELTDKLSLNTTLGYEKDHYDPVYLIVFDDEISPNYYDVELIKFDCHINFNFSKKNKKLLFYIFSGPTINTSFYEKTDLDFTKKIRFHNIHMAVGFGSRLNFKKIFVTLEPNFKTRLLQNKNNLASEYYNRLGFDISLFYHFERKK